MTSVFIHSTQCLGLAKGLVTNYMMQAGRQRDVRQVDQKGQGHDGEAVTEDEGPCWFFVYCLLVWTTARYHETKHTTLTRRAVIQT